MAELLVELFSEEIPARMQRRAAEDFARLVAEGLEAAGLAHEAPRAYWTPRRLALAVDGLPETQPDRREEKKGPKVDAPQKAIDGFLKSAGLDSLEQCERRDTPKGPVWYAVIEHAGRATAAVLPELIADAIQRVPWPKSMRFAAQDFRWVRPLHGVLAVFDGAPLAGALDLKGDTLAFGAETRGHRFLSPAPFAVTGFADYAEKLRAAHVVLEPSVRRESIRGQLADAAEGEGLAVPDDPELLDEVTNLVEWPVVHVGRIDDAFMDVPAEALTASMRGHQKYFALHDADGRLAPRFAAVANIAADDGGAAVAAGNERVLRARLADAKYFWDTDRRTPLAERLPALDQVIFHARLGTLGERVTRLAALAEALAAHVPGCDPAAARRAAELCKADLVTEMVGEFPELQGIMGRYYALEDGEPAPVAAAIAAHYSPAGPNDACPTAPESVALALAEKLDTLVGFWLIDEKPTGSKDPFALRRAALGVIRLVLENELRLPLSYIFASARQGVLEQGHVEEPDFQSETPDETAEVSGHRIFMSDLLAFFAERMKAHYRSQGLRHDVVAAVFALTAEDDLLRLSRRVAALTAFLESEDGANLLTAHRRAANILKAEEKADGRAYDGATVDAGKLDLSEEAALSDSLATARDAVEAKLGDEDFEGAMAALSRLRAPVDAFFDHVTVNADDAALRANRLALLAQIRGTMGRIADFGLIEG